jgi:hypothetical protein
MQIPFNLLFFILTIPYPRFHLNDQLSSITILSPKKIKLLFRERGRRDDASSKLRRRIEIIK